MWHPKPFVLNLLAFISLQLLHMEMSFVKKDILSSRCSLNTSLEQEKKLKISWRISREAFEKLLKNLISTNSDKRSTFEAKVQETLTLIEPSSSQPSNFETSTRYCLDKYTTCRVDN